MKKEEGKKSLKVELRYVSLATLAVLIVLLLLEFAVAQITIPRALIYVFAVLQAGIILWEYMHVSHILTSQGEDENSEGAS